MLLTVFTLLVLCLDTIYIFVDLKKENRAFRRHLKIILFLGIVQLVFVFMSSMLYSHRFYLILSFPFGLLYGPSLLLAIKHRGLTKSSLNFWKHCIPFFCFCFAFILLIFNNSLRYQYHLEYVVFLHFFTIVQMIGYSIWVWTLVSSTLIGLSKQGGKIFCSVLFCVMSGLSMRSLMEMIENGANINLHSEVTILLYLIFLFFITFLLVICSQDKGYGPTQMEGHVSKQSRILSIPTPSKKRTVRRKSTALTREQQIAYRSSIEFFIETLAFLDSDMNKEKFCNVVEIPSAHVASFLKQEFNKGFNGFINQLRLNYAARQLKSDHFIYTIEDLSLICGFSSRASFYRNFQTEFGCSPHQFRFEKKQVI